MNNTLPTAIGSAGVTVPFWFWGVVLDHGWSVLIAVLGALVLFTTLWKNILDVRIKRKETALLEIELEKQK
jgi:hypothetical protein